MSAQTTSASTNADDVVARTLGATGMAGIGLIHLLDAPGKFQETPYLGWMYLGLIAASIMTAYLLICESSRRAWLAAAGLAASAIVGFTLTRTVGLPQATGDIGNWSEPIGMASLYVEGAVVTLSGVSLLRRRPAATTANHGERPASIPRTA
ncbi:MAG: hypothetical protein ACR2NB_10410 [Solirubrobacteraceae bacterium]